MKMRDIEVGKEYAVGNTDRYTVRAVVLETVLYRTVSDRYSFRGRRSSRPDGVRVAYLNADGERVREKVEPQSFVRRPWAEQEELNERERERRRKLDDYQGYVRHLKDELARHGFEGSVSWPLHGTRPNGVTLTVDAARRLVNHLTGHEIGHDG